MNIIKNILTYLGITSQEHVAINEPAIEHYPNLQESELKTHIELVDEHFSFLVNDLGFQLTRTRMDGHEHTTIFSKDNISVHIIFAHGTLPMIYMKNNLLPYDESQKLFNHEIVQEYSNEMKTIMNIHSERLKPAYEYFYKNDYDNKYFNEDFEKFGKLEYIEFMTLGGIATKDIILHQKGMVKFSILDKS